MLRLVTHATRWLPVVAAAALTTSLVGVPASSAAGPLRLRITEQTSEVTVVGGYPRLSVSTTLRNPTRFRQDDVYLTASLEDAAGERSRVGLRLVRRMGPGTSRPAGLTERLEQVPPGRYRTRLCVKDTDGGPRRCAYAGYVDVPEAPRVVPSPLVVVFDRTTVSETSRTRTVTYVNDGNIDTAPLAPDVTGPFAAGPECDGVTLAPDQSCSVSVVFEPTRTGEATGRLRVFDGERTSTVTLAGSGRA